MLSRVIPVSARALRLPLIRSPRVLYSTTTTSITTPQEPQTSITNKEEAPANPIDQSTGQPPVSAEESEFFEKLYASASKLTSTEEQLLDRQVYEVLTGETTTPLTTKLHQNKELVTELKSFIEEFTLNLGSHKVRSTNNTKSQTNSQINEYSRLEQSASEEPYTEQELFLRRQFSSSLNSKLGSELSDVYIPHKEIFYPAKAKNLSIAKLLAAGCHLGHSRSLYRSSNQPYIYGEYKGIHIIDLEQTLAHLKKAAKIVEGVAAKGGIILYVGTREGQARALEVAAQRSNGYFVTSKWVAGTLTNATEISTWERQEVDLGDVPTKRELTPSEAKHIVKPDLIVVLNPTENRVLLNEAIHTRVPTIGIIDTDSEPSLVTYPIPANDDSIRSTTLIAGVLSKAGEVGYKTRLATFAKYKAERSATPEAAIL